MLHSALDRPFAFINPSDSGRPASVRSTLVPDQFPNQAGTHTDVPIIERLFDLAINQIRAPVCPL
jgi:hypothetical protein